MTERTAHPVRYEYAVERALSDGRWVEESITPAATPEQAEEEAAWIMNGPRSRGARFRTVCRTITSVVITEHPAARPDPQEQS